MKQVDSVKFGERIRELRKERKWSQGKLGQLSGYKQQTIGWLESGKADDPRKQVLRLAEALGTTTEWLLFGTGERMTPLRVLPADDFKVMYEELPVSVQEALTKIVMEHRSVGEPMKRLKVR